MQTFNAEKGPQSKRRRLNASKPPQFHEAARDNSPAEAETDVDHVEEAEEGTEADVDGIVENDQVEDSTDPFEAHFASPEENSLEEKSLAIKLRALTKNQWSSKTTTVPKIYRISTDTPGKDDRDSKPTILGPKDLKLKQKLASVFLKDELNFNALESTIADPIFNYQDMLFCGRTAANAQDLRRLTCLHAINHILKTRDRVLKNNARLQSNSDLEFRDQGFTRPKVLMLLPTREACVKVVDMITSLCEPEQQENRKRFEDEYVDKEQHFSDDKPEDFRELFSGNDGDLFRLGMKFTRKTIKFFSQFYNSDIILASPLGLRLAIGAEDAQKLEYDFLSSIELVIVDHADAMLMQNWEHMEFVFEHLNLLPKKDHGCDFSRLRKWYADDDAKYFRQTIALAAFNTPEINALFFNQSRNWAGKVKINRFYPGAIQELGMRVKQTFSRLESPSFATDPETRFTYFTSAIVPSLTRRNSKESAGTVLFIPSYIDYIRIRNYLTTSTETANLSFGYICEYTPESEVSRARSHFMTGRLKVLVYTERAHHFKRYKMQGVKKIIMYGLPDNPIFYKEIVAGFLGKSVLQGGLEPGSGSVTVAFSKWDFWKLERIVGSERVNKMIKDKGDTFNFL